MIVVIKAKKLNERKTGKVNVGFFELNDYANLHEDES